MTTIFQDEAARAAIEAAYEQFRARLPPNETRVIETPFGATHVLECGPKGAPPLVVLHGALASSAHVVGELGPLVERFRVIAPDVIGQSVKSADIRLPLDTTAYADWLVAILDAYGLARSHVLGVSWGGFVARKLAEHAPERVDRLVLLVPAGFVSGPAWQGFTKVGIPMTMFRLFPSEERLRRALSAIVTTLDDEWAPYLGVAFRSYKLDMRIPPLARDGALSRFDRPTLVIGAGEDLSFPGERLLARAKELIPHAETELLANSKHSPPTDPASRARLGARIGEFLARAVAQPVDEPRPYGCV